MKTEKEIESKYFIGNFPNFINDTRNFRDKINHPIKNVQTYHQLNMATLEPDGLLRIRAEKPISNAERPSDNVLNLKNMLLIEICKKSVVDEGNGVRTSEEKTLYKSLGDVSSLKPYYIITQSVKPSKWCIYEKIRCFYTFAKGQFLMYDLFPNGDLYLEIEWDGDISNHDRDIAIKYIEDFNRGMYGFSLTPSSTSAFKIALNAGGKMIFNNTPFKEVYGS